MPAGLIIKLVGGLLGSIAGVGLLYGAYTFVGNYFTEKDNLRTRMCNARIELERERFEHKYIQETWDRDHKMNAAVDRIRGDAETAMLLQKNETDRYKKVVKDRDRLDRLARERPDALTRLATAATNKRWKEIEKILTDP